MPARPKILRSLSNKLIVTGSSIIVGLALLGALAPWLAPHQPVAIDLENRFAGPNLAYPLGTDNLGRCIFSRILFGARLSLGISFLITTVIVTLGTSLGLMAGLARGRLDNFLCWIMDIFLAFPAFILALGITGFLGSSLQSVILAVCSVWWAYYARLIRGLTISAQEKEFVLAARLIGSRGFSLVHSCILPQILPIILVSASLEMGWIIMAISGLSFLGVGVQPPTPEWGAMLYEARLFIQTAPHLMLAPGGALFLAILGFNFLGEGLRDVLQIKSGIGF